MNERGSRHSRVLKIRALRLAIFNFEKTKRQIALNDTLAEFSFTIETGLAIGISAPLALFEFELQLGLNLRFLSCAMAGDVQSRSEE